MPILGSQSSGAKSAPTTPTIGTATVTNSTTVSLTFTAPSSKLPITSYTATSSPSISLSTSGTTSPATITGTFASGTAYTFTLAAVNANGTSTASSASNSVTPFVIPGAAYFAGGQTTTNGVYSDGIRKLPFGTETSSLIAGVLNTGRRKATGLSNGTTAGYFINGDRGGNALYNANHNKLTFSNDSVSTVSSGTGVGNAGGAEVTNPGSTGWVVGGDNNSEPVQNIVRFPYSSESFTTIAAVLTQVNARQNLAGISNYGTAGYIAGGEGGSSNRQSHINKFTFSNETISTPAALLSNPNAGLSSATNSGTAGYYAGGYTGSVTNTVNKFTYSNETISTTTALPSVRYKAAGAAARGVAAYFAGGQNSGFVSVSTIFKLPFSNDTTETLASTLDITITNIGAVSNTS